MFKGKSEYIGTLVRRYVSTCVRGWKRAMKALGFSDPMQEEGYGVQGTGYSKTEPKESFTTPQPETSTTQTLETPAVTPEQDAIPVPSAPSAVPSPTENENPFPPITRHNFYKHPIFWARFLGYAIPLSFLLYVLYLNYLPFGYHKTFTINVGSANDTKPSEFYLEPSKDLSDRMTNPDGTTYRTLNGMATAVFKPNAVLKDAQITVSVEGDEGISLIPPVIDFDPNSVKWDYDWDFTKGVPQGLININNRAFANEGGTYFDGTAKIEMASSSDMFEEGPFMVYVEWMPTDNTQDFQEIVGHFNWDIFQNNNRVIFRVGRMNDKGGPSYTTEYNINSPNFFMARHSLMAIYSPNDKGFGYMQLYIDGIFIKRTPIGSDKIWQDYNGDKNLDFGKTTHGMTNFFHGALYNVKFGGKSNFFDSDDLTFKLNGTQVHLPINTISTSTLTSIKLHVDY